MAKKPAEKEKVVVEIENITRIRIPKDDVETALKKSFGAPENAHVSWSCNGDYDGSDVYSATIEYKTVKSVVYLGD